MTAAMVVHFFDLSRVTGNITYWWLKINRSSEGSSLLQRWILYANTSVINITWRKVREITANGKKNAYFRTINKEIRASISKLPTYGRMICTVSIVSSIGFRIKKKHEFKQKSIRRRSTMKVSWVLRKLAEGLGKRSSFFLISFFFCSVISEKYKLFISIDFF